jgi:hypothetical protein
MPGNNYNYGASYIMSADKTSVDKDEGATQLYREGLEFDGRVVTGSKLCLRSKLSQLWKLHCLRWQTNATTKEATWPIIS